MRRELEEKEIRDHCTFAPKLTAWDFYQHGNYQRYLEEEQEEQNQDKGSSSLAADQRELIGASPVAGNQTMMPQGDDDDLFDDVDEA